LGQLVNHQGDSVFEGTNVKERGKESERGGGPALEVGGNQKIQRRGVQQFWGRLSSKGEGAKWLEKERETIATMKK